MKQGRLGRETGPRPSFPQAARLRPSCGLLPLGVYWWQRGLGAYAFARSAVKVKHFSDTDTLLVTFSDRPIVETRDLNENVLIELDEDGRVVSMTVEHPRQQTDVHEFSYQLAAA